MKNPDIAIVFARQKADFQAAEALIREYVAWLGIDLSFQNFDAEMADLPAVYAGPYGGLLLATVDGNFAGVAGIRKFAEGDCELKRMFVRAEYRGLGLGQRLLTASVELAQRLGYATIKLHRRLHGGGHPALPGQRVRGNSGVPPQPPPRSPVF
jgi:carbonic anhydrase